MTRTYTRDEVRSLRIRSRRLATAAIAGATSGGYRSPQGLDLADFREYEPGDDVGRIDWNVTARVGSPWVRLYLEERSLSVIVLADVSRSTDAMLLDITARLLSASIWSGCLTALLVFTDRVRAYLPHATGPQHLAHLIRELNREHKEDGLTNPSAALYYAGAIPRRSLVFLLSDFICEDFTDALRRCRHRHEVIAVGFESEPDIPNSGLMHFRDPETGRTQIIDTANLASLNESAQRRRQRNIETFRQTGVPNLMLTRGTDHLRSLARFLR